MIIPFCLLILSCGGLDGDNSDFDFGDGENIEDPYANGYDRLPNSVRLATYNTHRCEGNITQNRLSTDHTMPKQQKL